MNTFINPSDSLLISKLLPELKGFRVTKFLECEDRKKIEIEPESKGAICPHCGCHAHQTNSFYYRIIQGLPKNGKRIEYKVKCYQYVCTNKDCEHDTFVPKVPFADKWSRKTKEATHLMLSILPDNGCSKTTRILNNIGMNLSISGTRRTLSRVTFDSDEVYVVGSDDVATLKGFVYAIIHYNLLTGEPLGLFEGRNQQAASAFYRDHPEIKVIARDRACAISAAAMECLPEAEQIADPFHLFQGLNDKASDWLRSILPKQFGVVNGQTVLDPEELKEAKKRIIKLGDFNDEERIELTSDLIAKYIQLGDLEDKKKLELLDQLLGISPKKFKSLIKSVFNYTMNDLNSKVVVEKFSTREVDMNKYRNLRLYPRQAVIQCVCAKPENKNQEMLDLLPILATKYPQIQEAFDFNQDFRSALTGDDPDAIDRFIEKYDKEASNKKSRKKKSKQSKDYLLQQFVNGLKQDLQAVKNAVIFPYNSGIVEGSNNKFKTLKRIGNGRMSLSTILTLFRMSWHLVHDDHYDPKLSEKSAKI